MRLQGRITRWDDERGFGFVSWHGDGSSVFVHIKAFPNGARRPAVGDIITYVVAEGKNGKSRAENVRFSDQKHVKKPKPHRLGSSRVPIAFTLFFCLLVIASAYLGRLPWFVLFVYAALSVMTFLAYGWDKASAQSGRWRTAESSLHLMGLLGGWPGGVVAQRYFRHKTSKREFLSVFWMTAGLNVLAFAYLVAGGDADSIKQIIR